MKQKIYYERKGIYSIGRNWASRVVLKFFPARAQDLAKNRPKVLLRPLPIYRAAMDAARMRDTENITRQLRKDTASHPFKDADSVIKRHVRDENAALEARETAAREAYYKSLSNTKLK